MPSQPPVFDAIDEEDAPLIIALLETSDVNARCGEYAATPLYHAVTAIDGQSSEIVPLLLESGADPRLGLSDCNLLDALGFAGYFDLTAKDVFPL